MRDGGGDFALTTPFDAASVVIAVVAALAAVAAVHVVHIVVVGHIVHNVSIVVGVVADLALVLLDPGERRHS
jgi:hypothetical protein